MVFWELLLRINAYFPNSAPTPCFPNSDLGSTVSREVALRHDLALSLQSATLPEKDITKSEFSNEELKPDSSA